MKSTTKNSTVVCALSKFKGPYNLRKHVIKQRHYCNIKVKTKDKALRTFTSNPNDFMITIHDNCYKVG